MSASLRSNRLTAGRTCPIPAIHIEGPFISRLDGPRGAHDPAYVRSPDSEEVKQWQEAAEGRIQIRDAVEAGARVSTHLGNGSHTQVPRLRNYIWEQLAEDRLLAGIISDGFHLPDSVLKVFARVKGPGRLILVSDVAHLAGYWGWNRSTAPSSPERQPTSRSSGGGREVSRQPEASRCRF